MWLIFSDRLTYGPYDGVDTAYGVLEKLWNLQFQSTSDSEDGENFYIKSNLLFKLKKGRKEKKIEITFKRVKLTCQIQKVKQWKNIEKKKLIASLQ